MDNAGEEPVGGNAGKFVEIIGNASRVLLSLMVTLTI